MKTIVAAWASRYRRLALWSTAVALLVAASTAFGRPSSALPSRPSIARLAAPSASLAVLGDEAARAIVRSFYAGRGLWRDCPAAMCWVHNSDWGSDALTDTLVLRLQTTGDATVPPILTALARTARRYAAPCHGRRCLLWSDVPLWDSIADSREYEAAPTNRSALVKAKAAFAAVEGSPVYDRGACPAIRYQRPFGRGDHLKTLETDSNGVKAALLLYASTHDPAYLGIARTRYAAIRRYFLDRSMRLYSVYVFDDGRRCTQVPRRFFASVNGNMIWNGVRLYHMTGSHRYLDEALETAHAVAARLTDPHGVFVDLQAENDIAEPLVEAMLVLARDERRDFARSWLLANATAAYSARKPDGTYGRFFDGPPPRALVTAWQSSGGFAMVIAAAALAPSAMVSAGDWNAATFVSHDVSHVPATIAFTGSGIAVIGTIGEICCQPGHVRIFVDGVETINRIGAWQNKSSSGRKYPGSVLFAWRWAAAGPHVVTLAPATYNAKEGGTFLHLSGYVVR